MKPAAAKPTLTPKLRFPEFRDGPGWEARPLEELSEFVGERVSVSKLSREAYASTENLLPDFGGFSLSSSFPSGGSVVRYRTNDILAANIRPYLKKIWLADRDGGASNDVLVFRAQAPTGHLYLSHVLKNERFVAYVMGGAKGLKMPRGDISLIRKYPVPTPSPAEQQKIADCLSSLDELIGAESQKLDALRDYKKGLMQQLFPREGETLPRLRFPEFQSAPEWELKSLSDVAENLDNKRVPITEKDRKPGKIPYYGASGVVDYVKDYLFDEDLLCISEDGANLVARTYPIAFSISGRTWVNNHAHVLRFENPCTQKIVEDYLNGTDLGDYLTGMAQPKLNKAMLDKIPVPLPDIDEQTRIATCLTSLDDLIAAQTGKLEALKTHKKGLMQSLFPSTAENAA